MIGNFLELISNISSHKIHDLWLCAAEQGVAATTFRYYCTGKLMVSPINRSGYLEHDVARGILKLQCKTWEFRATSCCRHPDLFITRSFNNIKTRQQFP